VAAIVTDMTTTITGPGALVVANVVVIMYATVRCLQKRAAGTPWGAIFHSTEFLGMAGTLIVNLMESVSKLPSIPPSILHGLSIGIALIVTILHTLANPPVVPPLSSSITAALPTKQVLVVGGVNSEKKES